MLTAFIDENFDKDTGCWIVAGYVGKSRAWNRYKVAWSEAKGTNGSLHLAKMRLGAASARRRHQALLNRLALIPKACGLKPFVGSICEKDYMHLEGVAGTVLEPIMAGYVLAILALMDRIATHLQPDERIEMFV